MTSKTTFVESRNLLGTWGLYFLLGFMLLGIPIQGNLFAQNNPTPFDHGDRVDVYFADNSLQSIYHGQATTKTVSGGVTTYDMTTATPDNGNDFYTIACDSCTETNVVVSEMISSNNRISPFLGVGDVAVYRNAGQDIDGNTFDVALSVTSATSFPGSLRSVAAAKNNLDGGAHIEASYGLTRYLQPNSSGSSVSFCACIFNLFWRWCK